MSRLIERAFELAKKELGVHETGNNNPRIVEYLKCVDLDESELNEGTPWCSAFMNFCIQQAGGKGTRNAMARSWLQWGKKLDQPVIGCIIVFWRGSIYGDEGHVAMFAGYSADKTMVMALGGNEDNCVEIKAYPASKILGFRTSLD